MKIQVNSNNTIAVDASMTHFVEDEVSRILGRFAAKLSRVEVHLSDIDAKKTGQADKRCLVEVRPIGEQPLTATANAKKVPAAVAEALGKVQRALTTFFGRRGRPAESLPTPVSMTKKVAAKKTIASAEDRITVKKSIKKSAAREEAQVSSRGPKKKAIYQARRKSWPGR